MENQDHTTEEQVSKKARVESAPEVKNVDICTVCMEEGTEESPIIEHQCPRCAKDAWKICLVCNEALLSRTCPVCRGDYAAVEMHLVPGLPLKRLADPSLNDEEKTKLLYKFGVIRQVIGRSNVAAWSEQNKKMFFSLPQKITSKVNADEEVLYSITSVPLDPTLVAGDVFLFTNQIWDAIENEVEHGAIHAGEEVELQGALNHILNVTKEDGHKLYTMMSPNDWDHMMDPSGECKETSEALRIIRQSILQPVLSVIPAANTNSDDAAASK